MLTCQVDVAAASPCVTLAFAPAEPHLQPLADATMRAVARSAGLRFGVDVKGFESPQDAARGMFDHLYLRHGNGTASTSSASSTSYTCAMRTGEKSGSSGALPESQRCGWLSSSASTDGSSFSTAQ